MASFVDDQNIKRYEEEKFDKFKPGTLFAHNKNRGEKIV